MLKLNTDLFLDDKKIKEVETQLSTKIHVLDDSNDIIDTLVGTSNKTNT
jgi:NifB/MoaA-like Fe-S oxidoreductase